MLDIRRRQFITLLGGAAAAWHRGKATMNLQRDKMQEVESRMQSIGNCSRSV